MKIGGFSPFFLFSSLTFNMYGVNERELCKEKE